MTCHGIQYLCSFISISYPFFKIRSSKLNKKNFENRLSKSINRLRFKPFLRYMVQTNRQTHTHLHKNKYRNPRYACVPSVINARKT